MKITSILLIIFLVSVSCKDSMKQQYFESSPEIDLVKKGNMAYLNKDWQTLRSLYTDSALLAENIWERDKMISADQYIEESKKFAEMLDGYNIADDAIYNMIINDNGEKWVLTWFKFVGKTKDGREVSIPVNMNLKFERGKIAFQSSMYDQLPIFLALQPDSVHVASDTLQ